MDSILFPPSPPLFQIILLSLEIKNKTKIKQRKCSLLNLDHKNQNAFLTAYNSLLFIQFLTIILFSCQDTALLLQAIRTESI